MYFSSLSQSTSEADASAEVSIQSLTSKLAPVDLDTPADTQMYILF